MCDYLNLNITYLCYTRKIIAFAQNIDSVISNCRFVYHFNTFLQDFYNNIEEINIMDIDEKDVFYLYVMCLHGMIYEDNKD